ncbi:iron-containing alcohol dehydrogenase family protein [Streptococcus sobrinus]|uniref:3-dehydroquinate synthase n=3 Tax=Streptococcus sobrinus TaxID=1310 RepID=U2J905_9STRE|nr:iron-containing alcohol dehydrogenase family protein [Streptococcus sobrinus]ERJ76255.1 3-dehydroquinate synthase [Streptococcus sobrinus W1703]
MTTTVMANYSYGEDCYQEIPKVLKSYGIHRVALIGGKRALAATEKEVREILSKAGIETTGSFVYGVDSTQTNIDKLVAKPAVQEADAIFGFGGGRALDTTKMVAKELDKPTFTFPTICSNCSAGTAIAVVYKDDHSVLRYGYPNSPLHIFINTRVIAQAPSKYFWAGIGDGISKAPEVEHAVAEAKKKGLLELPHTATLGHAVALSSKDAFYYYGKQGLEDVKNKRPSKAVEEIALDIVVSTGYASNLVNQPDFYYNSCHAHAFYNGTTAIQRQGEYLHGVVVSYGVLVLHAYFEETDELERVAQFNKELGLPTTLKELGLTQADVPKIVQVALTTNEYKNTPFDGEKFAQAILAVDQLGQKLA